MKKTIFTLALAMVVIAPMSAKKATKEYQRPSLHMVLMTSDEKAAEGKTAITDPTILGYCGEAWKNYEFPALYNDFRVEFGQTKIGAAKGSIMDLLSKYSDPAALEGLGIEDLKQIVEMMKGKEYLEALKGEVDKVTDEVAHQLVKKWWSISEDGSCSDSLLFRLACYSATQNQANDAALTTTGAQVELFNKLSDATMSNTFVTFSKVDFYENEPIALFIKNIMMLIANMTPSPLNAAVALAADKTYEATREGYTAFANTLLYSLEWNDSVANEFYSIWKDGSHIDMAKFNAMKFNLKFIGSDKTSVTCMMKKEDRGNGAEHMVYKTIHKTLNKQFALMQKNYEEFRPMMPVVGIDEKGLVIADMGTKEGVKVGDTFKLLNPVTDADGITKYNYVGSLKVMKDGVWDNENEDNAANADLNNGENAELVGTKLSKFKKATPSMFVKLEKSK